MIIISHHHILSKLGMHPWRQEECPCPHTKLLPNIHQYSFDVRNLANQVLSHYFVLFQPGFFHPSEISAFFLDFFRIEAKKRLLRQKAQSVALQLLGVYQTWKGRMDAKNCTYLFMVGRNTARKPVERLCS